MSGAPTLPSKAERDELRGEILDAINETNGPNDSPETARTALRLLDWAEAQEARAEVQAALSKLEATHAEAERAFGMAPRNAPTASQLTKWREQATHQIVMLPADTVALIDSHRAVSGALRRLLSLRNVIDIRVPYRAGILAREFAAAVCEAEAVLAGGQPAPRVTVGYVWRSPSGGCTQYWYANDPDDEERLTIEQCRAEAWEARETCGGTIRKLTRPVRDKSTGGG